MGNKTEIERFTEKRTVNPITGCWEWRAFRNLRGYGRFKSRVGQLAHRFSYVFYKGPIPEANEINHKCRNTSCVNPDHLEALTSKAHHDKDKDLLIASNKKHSKKRGAARRKNALPEGVFLAVKRGGEHRSIYSKLYLSPTKTFHLGTRTPITKENTEELHALYISAYRYLHGEERFYGCFPPNLL